MSAPFRAVRSQAETALDIALQLIECGALITPVTITKDPKSKDPGSGDKVAKFHKSWTQDTAWTSDAEQVRAWARDHPQCSWAISCERSGIDVVDLDRKGKVDGIAWWMKNKLPMGNAGMIVESVSGGLHLYWRRRDDGRTLATTAGQIGGVVGGVGVDTRGDGGLVFAPGAYIVDVAGSSTVLHSSAITAIATWPTLPDEVIDLPGAAPALAAPAPIPATEAPQSGEVLPGVQSWGDGTQRLFTAEQAEDNMIKPALKTLEGSRHRGHGGPVVNGTLNSTASMLGHFVGGGFLTEQEARDRLTDALLSGPGAQRDTGWDALNTNDQATIASGLTFGMKQPATLVADAYVLRSAPDVVDVDGEDDGGFAARVAFELLNQRVRAEATRLLKAQQRPPVPRPKAQTLTELLAAPRDPVVWRIDGLMGAGGRVLLAAQDKAGKSTLVANLVRSLVDGVPFLGQYPTTPVDGRVVLLDTELPGRKIVQWYDRIDIGRRDDVIVFPLRDNARAFDLSDPDVMDWWVAQLCPLRPSVLILDPLRPVLDAIGLDESREASRFLDVMLGELLSRIGCAESVVVQHMGHAGLRARGDSAQLGWPDANWKIRRADPDNEFSARHFSAYGRDVEVHPQELILNTMTGLLAVPGESSSSVESSRELGELLGVVAGQPGINGRDLETAMNERGHGQRAHRRALGAAKAGRMLRLAPGPKRSTLHYLAESPDNY